jgi:hypothetical protein
VIRTTTTVREYDDKGRVVKETTTVVEEHGQVAPQPLPAPWQPHPIVWPGPIWCDASETTPLL